MIPDEAIDITDGIPSEIYVGIGRGRYNGERGDYELAHDVAEAVHAEYKAEIDRLRARVAAICDRLEIDPSSPLDPVVSRVISERDKLAHENKRRAFIVADYNRYDANHPYAHELRARYPWLVELVRQTEGSPGMSN